MFIPPISRDFPSASLARRAAGEIQGDTGKQGTKTNVPLQIPRAALRDDSHRRAGCRETSSQGGEKN